MSYVGNMYLPSFWQAKNLPIQLDPILSVIGKILSTILAKERDV